MSDRKSTEDQLFKIVLILVILGILFHSYSNMNALQNLVRHLTGRI
jgi:hypothetical protein